MVYTIFASLKRIAKGKDDEIMYWEEHRLLWTSSNGAGVERPIRFGISCLCLVFARG